MDALQRIIVFHEIFIHFAIMRVFHPKQSRVFVLKLRGIIPYLTVS